MQADLSKKDEQFREFSLNGPMCRVVLYVGFPLALYESLNQLFKILDTMMASHIGASAVSAVAYLSQINMMISAVGTGLAVGASIKVSQAYGAGDFMLVKKRVSTMFAMCGALGIAILLVLVPFTPEFLRLMNTPEEFIADGSTYFRLELFGMVITFFNNVYIAIERARGNSKRILILNTAVIVVKLGLTAWFVYGLGGDAIAAYTACNKLETFVVMPMYSIAVAMVTFTAQNFGAKQYQRIRKGMKVSLLSCLFFSVVVGGLIIVFCKPLVSIFVGSGAVEVIRLSRIYNSIEASCLWCAALLFTYRGAVQGTGNTKIPMMGGFLELLMRVFAALCLSRIWGFPGLAMAYPLAWIFAALLNMWYYRKLDKNDFQCTRTSSI